VLEELERLNLFITPLDHRRRWYRYHQLFAEWLQLRAPPGAAERHRRAADWLAAHAMPGEAVGHYVQAGEFAAAADLVESRRWELVGQGRQHTLRDWIQALPTADAEFRPALTLAEAWIAYHEGRWDAVAALAETVLDRSDEASGARADAIRAEALCLIAGSLVATGRTAEAGAFAGRALEIVPDHDSNIASALWLITGKVALLGGELDQATRAFAAARRLEPDVPIVEVIARSHRAEILRRLGQPAEAARQARAALAAAEGSGLQDHPEAAVAHLVLSQLTTAEEATAHLARGTDLAGRIPYQPRVRLAASAHRRLGRSPPGPARGLLSRRELDVLRLLASSMSQDEIASELYVSINTLKSHTRSIYQKLGVNSRHEAIEQARRDELL
jgi:LuxR family maltose regulon positive regulatory protein